MVKRSFKLLFRTLLKNKLNSAIIIISLMLGLSSSLIIFSWAAFEYSYDDFHNNKDRIYRVLNHQTPKGQGEQFLASVPEYLVNTFEEDIPGIELSTVLVGSGSFWTEREQKNIEIKNVYYSDNNLFNIFSFKFLSGNPNNCLSLPGNAVLTENEAKKLFGKENPLGKTLNRNGNKEYVITAIIEDIPTNSHLKFNMLLSMEERKASWQRNNGNHNSSIYVLLGEGIEAGNLTSNLVQFTDKHFPWNTGADKIELQALSDLHLNSKHTMWELNWNKFDKTYVSILLLVAFLILIISSINFLNLSLVSLSKRKVEIGIKKINGSGKAQIIKQFLFEYFILAGIACVFAFLLILYSYPFIRNNFLTGYDFNEVFNSSVIALGFSFVFFLVLLAGFFPALNYSSLAPNSILSGNISKKIKGKSFKHTLVISQLAVTTFLIITSFVILKQMYFIKNIDLGINTEQVLTLPTNNNLRKNYSVLKEELLKNPLIYDVTISSRIFGTNFWRNSIHFEGQEPGSQYTIPYLITDFNFAEFYAMEIVDGRTFSKDFKLDNDGLGFLINESLARELAYENPVGKKMRFSHTRMGEIIGVVKDFHFQSLHNPIEPMAFYTGGNDLYEISAKLNSANINDALLFLESTWKQHMPNRPFTYQFMDNQFANLYQNETKTTKLVLLLSLLSIILSSLGLFGLISFVSELKTKEIGVRKVNGAKISEVMVMLSKNYAFWGILGFVIATPTAWYAMNKWLENFAYKTTLSWWIFALAGVLALGIALLTVSWQSWRAATRNPVEALRYE